MDSEIGLVLGVDPDPFSCGESGGFDDRQLLESGTTVAGMDGDGGAGGLHLRLDQLAVERMERAAVDACLEEADALSVDILAGLGDPAPGELAGGLRVGIGGQELEIGGAVGAGVRLEFDVGGAGQSEEEGRITAEVSRRTFEDADFAQFGESEAEDFVRVVSSRADGIGADELDEDVFVGQDAPGGRLPGHGGGG